MNKVILIGRLTRDPESRMSQNNMEIARFSLACSSDFVSRTGERDTEFINCVAFGRLASTINRYCKKGTQISATGRIRNSSYDAQDGSKRYTTDIVIDQMEFLGSSQSGSRPNNSVDNSISYSPSEDLANNIDSTDINEDPYNIGDEYNLSDDDLPFSY